MSTETIAAVATAPGKGGVGIVRMSGPSALFIAEKITRQSNFPPKCLQYTPFHDELGELLDLGMAVYFKGPQSFTGEDVIELQAHGSPMVLDGLLKHCIALGARHARPGEFSERAFLNDKIDLTQAEAIADLIESQSRAAASLAIRSLQGVFSEKINTLVDELTQLRVYVEAAIDFPEEEIDFLSDGKVAKDLAVLIECVSQIMSTANQGCILQEGMSVVIAGRPNAGKSTLLNRLAGKDLAIVTDIPGTTRDVMREHILMDDIPLHIIDTAGLRDSSDVVEQEGIRRAWQEIKQANCVLLLIDIAQIDELEQSLNALKVQLPQDIPIITLINKIDTQQEVAKRKTGQVWLSAKQGVGVDLLKEELKKVIGFQHTEGQFSARRRHLEALERAYQVLQDGQRQLLIHRAGELLADDLRQAQMALCEITGEFSADDLLGKIFSSFCIGK